MKRQMLTMIVFLSSLVVFLSFEKENNAENTKKPRELTSGILSASEWQEDVYGCFLTMCGVKFTMDMKFTGFSPNAESDGNFSGTYKIENNRLTLSDGFDCTNGVLVNDDSLRYRQRIEFDNARVLHNTKSINIDRKQMLNNISIITMGMKEARTSTNLKFRETPDIKGKELTYYQYANGQIVAEIKYIPAGTTIYILARTEKKFKVQKWENYWYYIDFLECRTYDENCHIRSGWVFAEFVK